MQTRRSRNQPSTRQVDLGHSVELFDGALSELADRVVRRSRQRSRFILGIVGEPGAGKSTVSDDLKRTVGDHAVVVPFDGFHLANVLLKGTDLNSRKGAIDTL